MKTTNTLTKYIALAMLILCMAMPAYGQIMKRPRLGAGVMPLVATGGLGAGVYAETIFRGSETITYELRVSVQGYQSSDDMAGSLSGVASINYHYGAKKRNYYGVGFGFSHNSSGGFGENNVENLPVIVPRIGVLHWNHMNIGGELYLSGPDFIRLALTIGFVL